MNFNLLNSLILAGVIQGLIFGIGYLFSKKYRGTNTFYLSALIITFSYNNLQFWLSDAKVITGIQMYETLYIPVGSLIPVFLYFYVLVFLSPQKKITRKLKLLYIPFLIFLFFLAIPYKIGAILGINERYYETYRFLNGIQSSFSLLYTLLLIFISFVTVLRFKTSSVNSDRNSVTIERRTAEINWIKYTLFILFCLACFWAYALIKFFSDRELQFYFRFLWLGLSLAIYYLGHFGIRKFGIQKERNKIRSFTHAEMSNSVSEKSSKDHKAQLEEILVNNKRYLDPNLSLDSLAEELKLSKSHLSRIINSELNTSFSDYVNSHRVQQAKRLLLKTEFSNYTLVSIGLEAGFNSKTTFNNVFKKHTGLTPSQFKKENS